MADGANRLDHRLYDVALVGGGIIGLATAYALLGRMPGLRLVVLEKETRLGVHQSGHNSGVIHSGVYYRPGSLKARLCLAGAARMLAFCTTHGIRHERCGKVIVATAPSELPALQEIQRRGMANGVEGLRRIGREELRELEPHAAGMAALHVPTTGIADYPAVVATLAKEVAARGGDVCTRAGVRGVRANARGLAVETYAGDLETRLLVNCAGLHADTLARRMGAVVDLQILPFRGEYYLLRPEYRTLVRGLIYPVPDPRLPFLGVHFTRTVEGEVEAGPNAVLALAREGYRWSQIHPGELWEALRFPGLWQMAKRHRRAAMYEYWRSLNKRAFVASLRRLIPDIRGIHVVPGGSGVRAQAVSPDGTLIDDFRIVQTASAVHVLNAPSPAATASLAIGEYIADLVLVRWDLHQTTG